MKELIGLYGGTFDPPHKAHLLLARAFLKRFESSRLIVMPCLVPPHKERLGGANGKQRLEMARLCFGGTERVSVSDYELNNPRTSYTYLTVKHLMEENPGCRICLIMGQDNLMIMEKWKEYRFLLDNCTLAVAVRGGEPINDAVESLKEKYGAEIHLLEMERSPLSSTEIRRLIARDEDVSKHITKDVYKYIKREGLYL